MSTSLIALPLSRDQLDRRPVDSVDTTQVDDTTDAGDRPAVLSVVEVLLPANRLRELASCRTSPSAALARSVAGRLETRIGVRDL